VQGTSVELSGAGDRVLVSDHPSLRLTRAITLAAWIRPNGVGSQTIAAKASAGAVDGYELGLSSSGKVFVRLNEASSGDLLRVESGRSHPDSGSEWMHVTATSNGEEIRLYLDGTLEASLSAPDVEIAPNEVALSIGAREDGQEALIGAIDQVHLFATALDADRIRELYQREWVPPLDEWGTALLTPLSASATTGEKPQSKLWLRDDVWWAVLPDSSATWLRRLDGDRWTPVLRLSTSTKTKADYELDGEVVHVLLFQNSASQLVSLEYEPGEPPTYRPWTARPLPSEPRAQLERGERDVDPRHHGSPLGCVRHEDRRHRDPRR
jgi:hypothetical protein